MEYPGNIPTFNIPGTLFRNIRRNFIGNFFWIYQEYIVGMLHQYSTNRYLPGVCVCVCVYVCVYVYTLPPADFFRLHDVCDIHEMFGSTIFCCEYY